MRKILWNGGKVARGTFFVGFGVLNTREGVSLSNLRWLGREPVGAGYASSKVVRVLQEG